MDKPTSTLRYQEGPHSVSHTTFLLETNKTDPLSPGDPTKPGRKLPLSIYQPLTAASSPSTTEGQPAPYIPQFLEHFYDENFQQYGIPSGTIARMRISTGPSPAAGPNPEVASNTPLLIFSHGSMASRFLYQSIVSAVASAGYTVISIDHTHDAAAVQLPSDKPTPGGEEPGSELVENNYDHSRGWTAPPETWDAYLGNVVARMRGNDIHAVLDAVEAGSIPGLEHYAATDATAGSGSDGKSHLRVGVWGHSLGGASAVWAAALDARDRVAGVVNFDGAVLGDARTTMSSRVSYLGVAAGDSMGHPTGPQVTWSELWETLERDGGGGDWGVGAGYRRWIVLDGAAHLTFTDFPAIMDGLGIREEVGEGPTGLMGKMGGDRMREVVYAYVVEFFDLLLRGGDGKLLDGVDERFPEVTFEKEGELPKSYKNVEW